MLDGSSIAAILTGVLALIGAIATAWMSGWNEQRVQARHHRKALARYSVPLLIAAWDLANWFYDILEDSNYSPQRCNAYGSGWNSQFTSYLLGQYFAGVHIIREKTHFFAHLQGGRADTVKHLLWKIQDEFVSMNYEERENLEMRWFEGDILAAQEHMTQVCDLDGDGIAGEMRTIGWVDFRGNYATKKPGSNNDDSGSLELKRIFRHYEIDFLRVVFRRFQHLYSTRWKAQDNPQKIEKLQGIFAEEDIIQKLVDEDQLIHNEREANPNAGVMVPDHRIRRLQHLLSDLVELLDQVSAMKFNRPIRRCGMLVRNHAPIEENFLDREVDIRIPCDCRSLDCNPTQQDFQHRQLTRVKTIERRSLKANSQNPASRTPTWPDALGVRSKKAEEKRVSPC